MRKVYSFIFTFLILLYSVVPVVSAAEIEQGYTNLLDYSTANNSGSNTVTLNEAIVYYALPVSTTICEVDILFTVNSGTVPSGIQAGMNGMVNLTRVNVSGNLYRAYGSITNGIPLSELAIKFSGHSTPTSITFLRVNISAFALEAYPTTGFFSVNTDVDGNSPYQYMENANTPVTYNWGGGTNNSWSHAFKSYVYLQNWTKYDYMDVILLVQALSIDSISVTQGSTVLPFTVSYLNADGDAWEFYWPDDGDPATPEQSLNIREFAISVRVDLRNCDRQSSKYPCIEIHGQYASNNIYNYVTLKSVSGFIELETDSGIMFFINRIGAWFQELFNVFRGDTSKGDQFQEDVQTGLDNIKDSQEVFDSVEKPDLEDLGSNDFDAVGEYDGDAIIYYLFVTVFRAPILGDCFIFLTFAALFGFILYGRR